MNTLDVILLIIVVSSLFRGFEIGFVRQSCSTAGFIGGLFLGAWLQHFTVHLVSGTISKSVVTIVTTLGCALLLMLLGEFWGALLKARIMSKNHLNRFDGWSGSLLAAATVLVSAWLAASILSAMPSATTQQQIRGSYILSRLNTSLPPAPNIVASIGRLIDPNGFPQVFTGSEPQFAENTTPPGISAALQAAIDKDKASVVKLEGLGCGGVVDGSGFVIGDDLVATNAHVIAGVSQPYVKDTHGQHSATPIWFDPELDFALVRVNNLAGPPLLVSNQASARGSDGVVIGYPGGGALTAGGAKVIDEFTARGRDIYGSGITERDVYSLAAKIIPGNSGGPVIDSDGTVIGVVFATSTTYDNVGYALSTPQLQSAISQARAQNRAVGTGSCAE